jgi:hypothetical protein
MVIGRITTQMTQQMTLADLQQSMDQLDTAQQQMSTGKQINQPSDDPYGTSLSIKPAASSRISGRAGEGRGRAGGGPAKGRRAEPTRPR